MVTKISDLRPYQIIIFESGTELHVQNITKFTNGKYRVFGFVPSMGLNWELTKPRNYKIITY